MRALVVDDSRAIRGIIAKIMRSLAFDTVEASNGREAMDLLAHEGPFDVVTVNWEMPVMDGLEFVAEVRRDQRYRKLPLLMISSESDRQRVEQALRKGVDQYLIKPCTPRSVASKLSALGLPVPGSVEVSGGLKELTGKKANDCLGQENVSRSAASAANGATCNEGEADRDNRKGVASTPGGAPRRSAMPGSKIRVLLVDDSRLVQRVVQSTLEDCGGFEVVGTASDGVEGLEKIRELSPEVVLLDVDMPRMDGLELLRQLRSQRSTVPVVMFSSRTERGAKTATDALLLGAKDFVFKPGGARMVDLQAGRRAIVEEIAPRLRWLARRTSAAPIQKVRQPRSDAVSRIDLVVVAASTGGPAALATVMSDPVLRSALPTPILIVQHMPALFTKHLAARLADDCGLDIAEATEGELLKPGMIRIAPGGRHLAVTRRGLGLASVVHDGPAVNSCRPSADVLFLSAAELLQSHLLAVMLTGMGRDGRDGCRAIRAAGGWIVAQDEASSVVWGMPGSVVKEGLADQVVPLDKIGSKMAHYLRTGRA